MKIYKKLSAALALSLTLSAGMAPFAAAESLWSDASYTHNIFADRKAREVGDILTIVISESTTTSAGRRPKAPSSIEDSSAPPARTWSRASAPIV